jgi:hypothetical protein
MNHEDKATNDETIENPVDENVLSTGHGDERSFALFCKPLSEAHAIRSSNLGAMIPRTTNIQTVAKYFLLVPWMYLQLAQRNTICVATWGGYSKIAERIKTLRCADSMSVAYQA